jgi:hypothetical protein
LEMLQTSTKPPIIATDGSVKPYRAQGTFAWVLADQDGNPWLRCHGPVNGTPINSFRYDLVKYTIECPTCLQHSETYDHLFLCCHPSGAGWWSQLKATLIKFTDDTNSHHLLPDILVTGIHNWINGLPFPMTQYPPDWHELIDSQSQIGWKQLVLGRFSVKWVEYCYNIICWENEVL